MFQISYQFTKETSKCMLIHQLCENKCNINIYLFAILSHFYVQVT
jgi:hypothetical protein